MGSCQTKGPTLWEFESRGVTWRHFPRTLPALKDKLAERERERERHQHLPSVDSLPQMPHKLQPHPGLLRGRESPKDLIPATSHGALQQGAECKAESSLVLNKGRWGMALISSETSHPPVHPRSWFLQSLFIPGTLAVTCLRFSPCCLGTSVL